MVSEEHAADQLRRHWFAVVNELSDFDLQRRTWLDDGNTNPHWSYVEFCESYPDNNQLARALRDGWLSAPEFAILSELGRRIETHKPPAGDDYDHQAILADPAWRAVVDAAVRARRRLLATTADPDERKMLLLGGR